MVGAPSSLGILDSGRLLKIASRLAAAGKIDPLSNLRSTRVYLYLGTGDKAVAPEVVEAAREFYLAAGVPPKNVALETGRPGGHAFVTAGDGAVCNSSMPPFVEDCGFDQAGALLNFIYGPLRPKGSQREEGFVAFDQRPYGASANLAHEGIVYVPAACARNAGCKVHVVFHGCGQSRADVGDAVVRKTHFGDWAETNDLVVVFPQVAHSLLDPNACWDWWGYTGLDFLTKHAPQVEAVEMMLGRLAR